MKKSKILLTGKPGIGKTTIIKKIMDKLKHITIKGFYTEELRTQGRREGFVIKGLSTGKMEILAHIEFKNPPRIGKYGVNISGLEEIIRDEFSEPYPKLIIVDEIGPMECISPLFRKELLRLLNINVPCLGTIKEKGDKFIEKVKLHPSVEIYKITSENRDKIIDKILKRVKDVI